MCRALATSRLLLGVMVGSCWVGSFVVGGGRGTCAALWPRPVCCSVCWLVRVVVEFCLCQAVQLPPEPPVKQDQLVVQPVPGPQDQTAAV